MTSGNIVQGGGAAQSYGSYGQSGSHQPANLGDILERVLDKGLVIAGDIQVNLLDIELLTIKLRLVIASLDTAREVGINWWETDPWLNADAARRQRGRELNGGKSRGGDRELTDGGDQDLLEENERLQERIRELEAAQRPGRSGQSGRRSARDRSDDE
jgi:hypothetical protein